MTKEKLLGAAIALSLLGSTAAMAEWNNDRWDNGEHARHVEQQRNEARREARWERGHVWPSEYRSERYVVSDWKLRHLRQPPRGYRWYRADDNYVLVRTKSNVIADIINALQ